MKTKHLKINRFNLLKINTADSRLYKRLYMRLIRTGQCESARGIKTIEAVQ